MTEHTKMCVSFRWTILYACFIENGSGFLFALLAKQKNGFYSLDIDINRLCSG